MSMVKVVGSPASKVREFFPQVSKLPLFGPEGIRTSHYGLFRMDSGEAFGPAVSNNYVPHTTDDVVALMDASATVFGDAADVQMGFDGGHFLSVQPTKEHRLNLLENSGGNDAVWMRLVIRARYGECFRASIGVWRDACRNLAIMRQVTGTSVVIRHTSGLRDRMNDLIEDFGALRGGWEALVNRMRRMEELRVNTASFLDQMFPMDANATERSQSMHRARIESIIRRVARERVAVGRNSNDLQTVTGFEAYQAVQGWVQHDRKRRGRPGDFDRIILAMSDATVARAEDIVTASLAV
jgi:hypothetical protein